MYRQKTLAFTTWFAIGAIVALGTLSDAYAQGTPAERRDCRPDAMRLCGDVVPDVPRVTACMQQNVKNLTPLCRQHFRKPAAKR